MTIADRMQELGIALPPAVPPAGIYQPAVRTGNFIIVSGQVASKDGAIMTPGHVGAEVTAEQGTAAARQCALNGLAAIVALNGTLDGLRLVRTVGYVSSAPDFNGHGAVVNGASEVLREILGPDNGVGARVSIGIASLPANSPVEVEFMFEVS